MRKSRIKRAALVTLMAGGLGATIVSAADSDSASCAFVAANEIRVGNATSVGGDLGANDPGGHVRLGRHVVLADGTTVAGDLVGVSNGSSLFDVEANVLAPGRGVTIRGASGMPTLPLRVPFCPVPVLECGGPDVVVHRGKPTQELAPGSYGDVTLENGTTLRLGPGQYDLCSLSGGRGVEIPLTGATASTVNVAGELRLENGSRFGPASGSPVPTVNVGGDRVRLGAHAVLEAFLAAPSAKLRLRHGAKVTGSMCADAVTTGHSVTLECAAGGPTSTTTTTTSTSTTSSTTSTTATTSTSSTSSTSSTTSPSSTTTSSSSSTTISTTTSSSTSTTVPSTTTSSTTTTSESVPTTSSTTSTTTTEPLPSTTTSTTTITSASSTTTTEPPPSTTTATTSTSTTTTTQPTVVTCGPNGVVARLAVNWDPRQISAMAAVRLDLRYPGTVSIPGTGVETDDSRFTIVTGIDGATFFFDRDDDANGIDDTLRIGYALTGGRTFPPGDLGDILFDCTPDAVIDAGAFSCLVIDAADPIGTSIPNPETIPCGIASLRLP